MTVLKHGDSSTLDTMLKVGAHSPKIPHFPPQKIPLGLGFLHTQPQFLWEFLLLDLFIPTKYKINLFLLPFLGINRATSEANSSLMGFDE